jgi:hypothetical protein
LTQSSSNDFFDFGFVWNCLPWKISLCSLALVLAPSTAVKRPVLVWVIFLFYLVATLSTFAGLFLIYSGRVAMNSAQQAYFAQLTIFDHLATVLLVSINLVAAIMLFRLRRTAVALFAAALALNLILTLRAMLNSNQLDIFQQSGAGVLAGLITALVVLLYSLRLLRRAVLY